MRARRHGDPGGLGVHVRCDVAHGSRLTAIQDVDDVVVACVPVAHFARYLDARGIRTRLGRARKSRTEEQDETQSGECAQGGLTSVGHEEPVIQCAPSASSLQGRSVSPELPASRHKALDLAHAVSDDAPA